MARIVTIFALAAAALAGAAGPPENPVREAARCYALEFGQWTVGGEPLSMHVPLPDGVALTDSVFWPPENGRPTEYWAVRLRSVGGRDRRRAFWHRTTGDSLLIRLPAWWSTGIVLALPAAGDTLVGRADVYVDYSPVDPTFARVTARRQKCPAFKIE